MIKATYPSYNYNTDTHTFHWDNENPYDVIFSYDKKGNIKRSVGPVASFRTKSKYDKNGCIVKQILDDKESDNKDVCLYKYKKIQVPKKYAKEVNQGISKKRHTITCTKK